MLKQMKTEFFFISICTSQKLMKQWINGDLLSPPVSLGYETIFFQKTILQTRFQYLKRQCVIFLKFNHRLVKKIIQNNFPKNFFFVRDRLIFFYFGQNFVGSMKNLISEKCDTQKISLNLFISIKFYLGYKPMQWSDFEIVPLKTN